MSSKREPNRLRLFARFSENLALLHEELKGRYVCPLCLRDDFSEDSVRGHSPDLTEEHCIPDGLGENVFVLTCAGCNNTTGRTIDSHLHKLLKAREFWKGTYGADLPARIDFAGNSLAVNIRRTAGEAVRMDMFVVKKACDPEAIRRSEESIRNKQQVDGFKLHFGPNETPDTRRSRIALVKSAYLLMFQKFGYSYILHDLLDPVRQQIQKPKEKILPLSAIVLDFDIDQLPPTIAMVTPPKQLEACVVPIALHKYGVGKVVALPSHSQTYANWQKRHAEQGKDSHVRLSCAPMGECDILSLDQHLTWEPRPSDAKDEF